MSPKGVAIRHILEGHNGTANSISVMEEPLQKGSQDAHSLRGRRGATNTDRAFLCLRRADDEDYRVHQCGHAPAQPTCDGAERGPEGHGEAEFDLKERDRPDGVISFECGQGRGGKARRGSHFTGAKKIPIFRGRWSQCVPRIA